MSEQIGPCATLPNSASQAVNDIDNSASEILRKNSFRSSSWQDLFVTIEDKVDQFINDRIHNTDAKKYKELIDVVKQRREKLALSSGSTTPIIGISQQILAFGAAGIALTVGFIDKVKQFTPLVQKMLAVVGIFYLELIALSLIVLLYYMLQARFRYPSIYFKKIGNAWPFFYYAFMTPVSRDLLQGAKTRFCASVTYAKDFIRFTDQVLDETEETKLRAELQQYFLLLSYQGYIQQFSIRLARLFLYGFIAALATAVIMLAVVIGGIL